MNRKLTILFSLLSLILLAAVPAGAAPLAGPCVAGQGYDPACDADHDGDIDVLDIQLIAGRWGASGTYVDTGWSLTGNAGTTPGTHFLGTTDNQALEVQVNGQRALRIEPAGSGGAATPNLIGGKSVNTVTPGVVGATIAGGGWDSSRANRVTDNYGTIGGGANNQAGLASSGADVETFATVAGGLSNFARANYASIGGGYANSVDGNTGTIGGGDHNAIGSQGQYATIGGGSFNQSAGLFGSIIGGSFNTAGGDYATVAGGRENTANGAYSFAAGRRAKATNPGAFVLADSNNFDLAPGMNNAFTARFTGGFRITLAIDGTGAPTWQCNVYNGGSWGCSSDRNVKENFQPVDGRDVLQKLMTVPITTWNAIGADPNVRRIGPMSQDFYAAFGLGDDDKVITTGDLDGVALASIQGLYGIVQELQADNQALRTENAGLQAQLDQINARLAALEAAK